MGEEVLLRFLDCGLLNVGGDDAKLEKLRATSADIAAQLLKSPERVLAYTLVAVDPEVPPDDEAIVEGLETLKGQWATYSNTFSGPPVAVIRAVTLDALVRASGQSLNIGHALVVLARNMLPHTRAGHEQSIWLDVVREVERQVDERAETEWTTPASIQVAPLKLEPVAPVSVGAKASRVDREALQTKIEAAAGPNHNSYRSHSQPAEWAAQLAANLTPAIADSIDAVGSSIKPQPIDLSAPFGQFSEQISQYVGIVLGTISGATVGLQRRVSLLWWKEALYSPSAHKSYRDLDGACAAAIMALDLYNQVPTFSPASVAALLRETVAEVFPEDRNKPLRLHDLALKLHKASDLAPLRDAAAAVFPEPKGRAPILSLAAYDRMPATGDEFRASAALDAATQLTLPNWAMWVFRELQAGRSLSAAAAPKRRTRKAS